MRTLKLWLPVIMWMAMIFIFSTDIFAGSNTSSLFHPVISWLIPSVTSDQLDTIHLFVRKFGHWTEYAILTFLLIRAVAKQFPQWPINWRCGCSLALAVIYAASDEWHQSFVPSRSASVYDFMIDGFGALCAILWQQFLFPDNSPNESNKP